MIMMLSLAMPCHEMHRNSLKLGSMSAWLLWDGLTSGDINVLSLAVGLHEPICLDDDTFVHAHLLNSQTAPGSWATAVKDLMSTHDVHPLQDLDNSDPVARRRCRSIASRRYTKCSKRNECVKDAARA